MLLIMTYPLRGISGLDLDWAPQRCNFPQFFDFCIHHGDTPECPVPDRILRGTIWPTMDKYISTGINTKSESAFAVFFRGI